MHDWSLLVSPSHKPCNILTQHTDISHGTSTHSHAWRHHTWPGQYQSDCLHQTKKPSDLQKLQVARRKGFTCRICGHIHLSSQAQEAKGHIQVPRCKYRWVACVKQITTLKKIRYFFRHGIWWSIKVQLTLDLHYLIMMAINQIHTHNDRFVIILDRKVFVILTKKCLIFDFTLGISNRTTKMIWQVLNQSIIPPQDR